MFRAIYRNAVIALARPYIRRELPGWGVLYRLLVGAYERDWLWQDEPERWVRGKLHGHEMSVRIGGWSNRSTFFLERFYDLPTQLLLQQELREGDLFVDVGANEGMITLLASRLVGPTGTVVSFEPNPVPREILRRGLQRNRIANVEVHACGLGDEDGELQLFVPRVNSGEGSFTTPTSASEGYYAMCPVRIGDSMLQGRLPKLIKIDVEGFEAHVLRGLRQTLERARPIIVMEMIARHLARDGQDPFDLCLWFEELGYRGQQLALQGRNGLHLLPMPREWQDGDYVFTPQEKLNARLDSIDEFFDAQPA
jgi:FkbM family methyltransferase